MPHPDNRISPFSAPRGGPPSRSPFRRSPRRRTGLIRRRGPSEQRGAARAPARTAASRRAVRPIGKGRNSTADSSHGTWTAVTARNKRFNSTVDNSHSTKQTFQFNSGQQSQHETSISTLHKPSIFSPQHLFSSACFLFSALRHLVTAAAPRRAARGRAARLGADEPPPAAPRRFVCRKPLGRVAA